jgi:choline dehydrogenase-like flavoprotein
MSKAILVVGGVISGGSKVRMAFKKLHGAATSYLRPVTDRENLTVVTEAQVVKLTLTGTRCTGLEFLWGGRRHSARASREVVLCAGAIHTPRLLLLSGIGVEMGREGLGEFTQTTVINAAK